LNTITTTQLIMALKYRVSNVFVIVFSIERFCAKLQLGAQPSSTIVWVARQKSGNQPKMSNTQSLLL
jgi:hypothetical protein